MVKKVTKKKNSSLKKKVPPIDKIKNLKQKKVLLQVLEDVGKGLSLSKAMEKAGYSKAYSKNPQALKKTLAWQELMEEFLPDTLLTKKHKELLEKKEVVTKNNNKTGKIETVSTGQIDVQAVSKGLDMAYKLKSKYGEQTIRHKFGELSDEELEEELAGEISEGLGVDEGEEEETDE